MQRQGVVGAVKVVLVVVVAVCWPSGATSFSFLGWGRQGEEENLTHTLKVTRIRNACINPSFSCLFSLHLLVTGTNILDP